MRNTMAKRPVGRGVALTLDEREQVAMLKAGGMSKSAIARKMNRPRKTIIATLKHADVEEMRQRARADLTDGLRQFVADWRAASLEGARRGRHEPARDALLHVGVIEPVENRGMSNIIINAGAPLFGCPGWKPDQDAVRPLTLDTTPKNDE
jgi:hypothetical protein